MIVIFWKLLMCEIDLYVIPGGHQGFDIVKMEHD